jgi:hypothetical protein
MDQGVRRGCAPRVRADLRQRDLPRAGRPADDDTEPGPERDAVAEPERIGFGFRIGFCVGFGQRVRIGFRKCVGCAERIGLPERHAVAMASG